MNTNEKTITDTVQRKIRDLSSTMPKAIGKGAYAHIAQRPGTESE
ncbi:hypothetical protein BANT10_03521 [Brevibacterium antiquum]|uniref:Uncharacterized protein n=2 Tax=Brevibacterium antiquum TaxID=234835 RepID=A0A2H1L084_9MICO|nr:hypothetical protein BANT10_03521 [Brevibacterium antiquum]SMY05423.1 hypothetical protein BANT918_03427 [Brevibacterium antiquum CNRZ 918]